MDAVDQLFNTVDRGKDGSLDFGDVVYMLKRLSPDQSLESARNAAVEALLLIGRGEAALAPPTSAATSAARRLDRADFRLLLDKVAAMAGVDLNEAAAKLLAQARRASFSLERGDDAAVARQVAAVDRRDSVLLDEKQVDNDEGVAAGGGSDDEVIRVLPSAEATAAAAAAVEASAVGGAVAAAAGGAAAAHQPQHLGRSSSSASTRRKALALATDPQLGLLFNAWCCSSSGNGGSSSAGGGGGGGPNAAPPKALSLADVAQGLCRLRPPKTKQEVADTLTEAAHAIARHDADGDGLLGRAEFASFVSALLSAAGVAFGDAAGALLEVAQARPASEAMRRTLEEHGEVAVRVLLGGGTGK
jgi:hypothetical protein